LRSWSHEVAVAHDGLACLALVEQLRPDVVLLDIGLPDMDGYKVARSLRADPRTRDVFIVAVTGYGRDEDRAKSEQAGIDLHMTKPVDIDALMEALARGRRPGKG
jgi:CheY-like chemotaxis protein